MAALDFPNSPTVGQIFTGSGGTEWKYDGVKWVPAGAGGGTLVTIGDVAPSGPNPGNMWFDSVGVQLYLYYNDPNSNQWVPANNNQSGLYLPYSGGVMTGPLTLAADAAAALQPVSLQQSRRGVTDGSSAAAGQIGEYLYSSAAAVPLTSGTVTTLTTLALTAGDWEVGGEVVLNQPGGGFFSLCIAAISTSAALPTGGQPGSAQTQLNFTSAIMGATILPLAPTHQSISAPQTMYLLADATVSTGAINATGKIWARRVR